MRVQLALNVADLDEAVQFYSNLFGVAPARERPGYANFAIENPPLKLVLFERPDAEPGSLNHLGVEVETAEEVTDAHERVLGAGLTTTGIDDTACCYATKTETWIDGPEGHRWEWYVRTGDSEQLTNAIVDSAESVASVTGGENVCC